MSREVDERVVEMKFKDADFKRGVSETLTNLDRLKNALSEKVSGKNFEELNKTASAVNFKPIENQLDSLNSKFGLMGTTVTTVWNNIVTGGMNMAKNLISKAIDPIINGGMTRALNMEQALFMFSNMKDIDTTAMMAAVAASVDQTAYSLDVAAKAAAQFAASGIKVDKMEGVLRAVAGTAAMGGASFEYVSEIFTKVAGQGRLMGDDLLRTGSLGLNVAAELGKAMGHTEADIRDLVTKGEISFAEFSDAMLSAFGESAAKANDTFKGSLSNLKSAFSRIGADVFQPGLQKMRDLFNTLRPVINQFRSALQPLIGWDIEAQWGGQVGAINEKFAQFIDGLINNIKNLDLSYFFELFNNLAGAIRNGISSGDGLSNTMRGLGAILKIVASALKLVVNIAGLLGSAVITVIGWFLELTGVIATWIVKLEEGLNAAGGFVGIFDKFTRPLKDFFTILKEGEERFQGIEGIRFNIDETKFTRAAASIHEWFEKIGSAGEAASDIFKFFGGVLSDVGSVLNTAFSGDFTGAKTPFAIFQEDGVLVTAAMKINNLLETVKNLFGYLFSGEFAGNKSNFAIFDEDGPILGFLERLRATTFTGIIDTVTEMWRVLMGGELLQGPNVYGSLKPVMDMLSRIHDWASKVIDIATDMWNILGKGVVDLNSPLMESDWGVAIVNGLYDVNSWATKATDKVRAFGESLKIPSLEETKRKLNNISDSVKKIWDSFTKGSSDASLEGNLGEVARVGVLIFDNAQKIDAAFGKGFGAQIQNIRLKWKELIAPIKAETGMISTAFSNAFQGAKDAGADNVTAVINGIGDAISVVIERLSQFRMSEFVTKVKTGFGTVKGSVKDAFDVLTTGELMQGPNVYGKLEPLMRFLKSIHDFAVSAASAIKETLGTAVDWTSERFKNFGSNMGPIFESVIEHAKKFGDNVRTYVGPAIEALGRSLAPAIEKIKTALSKLDSEQWVRLIESLSSLGTMGFLRKITKDLSAFGLGGIFEKASSSISQLTDTLKTFQKDVKARSILTIAIAIGVLAAAIFLLGGMDPTQLATGIGALVAIGAILGGVAYAISLASEKMANSFKTFKTATKDGETGLKGFEKITGLFRNLKWLTIATSIVIFSVAVLMLAAAMKMLTGVGFAEVGAFVVIMLSIAAMAKVLEKFEGSFARAGAGLIVFALGLMALTGVIAILGNLDPETLGQGVRALGLLMGYLAIFMIVVNKSSMDKKTMAGIIAMGEAIRTMANVAKMLGELDKDTLVRGITSVGILTSFMIAVARFSNFARNGTFMQSGAGLLMMAAGIMVMAMAVKTLGNMDVVSLAKGLGSVFLVLTAMVIAMKSMPKDMGASAAQLLGFAGAIAIISLAIRMLGGMEMSSLASAVGALGITMVVLATAMRMLPTNPVQTSGIIAMAAGVMILALALKTIGSMSWQEVLTGVIGMAAAMALIIGAGAIAGNFPQVAAGMIAVAGAVALVGAGMLAAGIGMTLFAAAMVAVGVAAVPFGAGIIAIAAALRVALPLIGTGLANAIVNILKVFGDRADEIKQAFLLLLQAATDALVEGIPIIVEGFALLLIALLDKIIEYGPQIAQRGYELLIMFLTGIRDHIEEVVTLGGEIIENFLQGIANSIEGIVDAGMQVIINFINGISNRIQEVVDAGVDLIVNFLNGIRDAIPRIGDAAYEVLEAFCQYVVDNFGRLATLANDTITELGSKLISAITSGVGDLLGAGRTIIENIAQGIKNGIDDAIESVKTKAAELGRAAVSGINSGAGNASPSKYTYQSGVFVGQGLINGLNSQVSNVEGTAEQMGLGLITAMTVALAAARQMVVDPDINPTLTPVLDLSEVQAGVATMSGMFTTNRLSIGADIESVKHVATQQATNATYSEDAAAVSGSNTAITFNQNNYSPKSLPKTEIYRQTRNQLSRAKEVINRS